MMVAPRRTTPYRCQSRPIDDLGGSIRNPAHFIPNHCQPTIVNNLCRTDYKKRIMHTLNDCFGNCVRLTDERLLHIREHPEMDDMNTEIESVLQNPQLVRLSRSDKSVRLFYRFYAQTIVGSKWLCVVVKYTDIDAFIITAYLTDKPKAGEELWLIK
jgi:hypothetical protein